MKFVTEYLATLAFELFSTRSADILYLSFTFPVLERQIEMIKKKISG
jgi:hypothetical protein